MGFQQFRSHERRARDREGWWFTELQLLHFPYEGIWLTGAPGKNTGGGGAVAPYPWPLPREPEEMREPRPEPRAAREHKAVLGLQTRD